MSRTDVVLLFVAEGFGLGRIRFAPGTWGSLLGIPLGWSMSLADTVWWQRLLVALAMFAAGVPLCRRAALLLGKKDPGSVVWDEVAAFPIVYAFVSLQGPSLWKTLLAGFILFRIFDIWKPAPVRHSDRIQGGFGIMIDDTVAAVYASGCLVLLSRLL